MNKINIAKQDDWLSIDEAVLHLLFKLIELNSVYENITFHRQNHNIEITNVGGNIILMYQANRNIGSNVMLKREECVAILKSSNVIINRINDLRSVPVKERVDERFPAFPTTTVKERVHDRFPPFPIENIDELPELNITLDNQPKKLKEDFMTHYGQGKIVI